jgi:predicted helicase
VKSRVNPPAETVEEWRLRLAFRATSDEEEDMAQISQALLWLPELPTRERVLLCEGLRRDGHFVLACEGPEEACRLLVGKRGHRVEAQVVEPDGREFRPDGAGLDAYASRRIRAVYATPRPLTRFILRAVDSLLRSRLGREGLCDRGVRLLDPAAGPMNFVSEACKVAITRHRRIHGRKGLEQLLSEHLVPDFVGFEILPGPWVEGLAAMRRLLAGFGVEADRLQIPSFLADALASPELGQGGGFLEEEARTAFQIKSEAPMAVVVGNPPFSGRSANRGTWIVDLLHGYTLPDGRTDEGFLKVDGRTLGEHNVKWLHDDYVKFLRLAQWIIDRNGRGVVGFVVNHNCLDAPTFRGLRSSLLRTFDEIYVLDLHGNQRRREKGPEGQRDENVFQGVAQGVAVLILVKRESGHGQKSSLVYSADLYGSRKEKLGTLACGALDRMAWKEVTPRAPLFLFRPSSAQREREYAGSPSP